MGATTRQDQEADNGVARLRLDHVILTLRPLIGDSTAVFLLHLINGIRALLGLKTFGGREEQDWILQHIPTNADRVLDLGASESTLRLHLRNRKHLIVSLDVRFLRNIDLREWFVLGDATRLPFVDGCFDVVALGSVIEHVGIGAYHDPVMGDGDMLAMREVQRVTKKRGVVLLTTAYSTVEAVTWQRHYSEQRIQRLTNGFALREKTYLLDSGKRVRPWRATKMVKEHIEASDPTKALVCLSLEKPWSDY
jgi:hypothetical protein